MGKGKDSDYLSGGGSRAAKKRRKQKDKVATETPNKVPPASVSVANSTASKTTAIASIAAKTSLDASATGNGKRKRVVQSSLATSSCSAPSAAQGKITGAQQQQGGAATGGTSSAAGGGNTTSRRGQKAGREGAPAAPVVIDASEADERSRLLLELDAVGVLSDPDVESGLKARQLLQWIVAPLPVEEFYESYW